MSQYETVNVERLGAVAVVSLNRPDSLNAFDASLRLLNIDSPKKTSPIATPDRPPMTRSPSAYSMMPLICSANAS